MDQSNNDKRRLDERAVTGAIRMEKMACFVVSQIGDKGSEARRHADSVFELIIEPALEKFGFDLIRADKIFSVGSITSEVVELVQSADLCVIDITGNNPNVMYECGRRHETGKPYIMLASAGEQLPFDINTIRTIFYNVADPREIRSAVKMIQGVTEKMIGAGFQPHSSGESLAAISESLKRIERTIGELVSVGTTRPQPPSTLSRSTQEIVRSLGLIGAFNYAMTTRDVRLAEELMPRLESTVPRDKFVMLVLVQTAALGSGVAARRLESEVIPQLESLDDERRRPVISAYVEACNMRDEEAKAILVLEPFMSTIKSDTGPSATLSGSDRAFYLNQYQKLLNGCGKYSEAFDIGELVIRLCPDEPTYYYNQSMNAEQLGRSEAALDNIAKCLALDEMPDDDHLFRAVKLYARAGRSVDARQALAELQEVNPLKAALFEEDKDVAVLFK